MDMIAEKAYELGRKLLSGMFGLVKKTAASTLKLTGVAVGKTAGRAKNQAGIALHKTGDKVRAKAADRDSALLLLGLVFAGLALLAFALRAYGRKE